MKCRFKRHFVWVFTVCKSTRLGVSSIQRVNTHTRLSGEAKNLIIVLWLYLLSNSWNLLNHRPIIRTCRYCDTRNSVLGYNPFRTEMSVTRRHKPRCLFGSWKVYWKKAFSVKEYAEKLNSNPANILTRKCRLLNTPAAYIQIQSR